MMNTNKITIDEMLTFLESLDYDDTHTMNAIRAILEQHETLQEAARRWEHHKAVSFLLSKEADEPTSAD